MRKQQKRGLMLRKDANCSICGKHFLINDRAAYVFKHQVKGKYSYQCSYTCYKKWKKNWKVVR